MDDLGFDRLTRLPATSAPRRLVSGALIGGMLAAVLGHAAAGKKRRKKRCKRLGAPCPRGGDKACCGPLNCDRVTDATPERFCCKREGAVCDDVLDCCRGPSLCATNGCSNPTRVCCGTEGAACQIDCDCCEGWNCECADVGCQELACKAP